MGTVTKEVETIEDINLNSEWENCCGRIKKGLESARLLRMSLNENLSMAGSDEQLLREMWDVSSPEERGVIAGALFKVVREHLRVFNNTCSLLSDSGDWYMWEEQSMADGGTPWA
jgi:hypothetical protein